MILTVRQGMIGGGVDWALLLRYPTEITSHVSLWGLL